MIYLDATIPYLYDAGIRNYFFNFINLLNPSDNTYKLKVITPEMFDELNDFIKTSQLNLEINNLGYVKKIPFLHRIIYYEFIFSKNVKLKKTDFLFSPYFQLPNSYFGQNIISTIHDTLFLEMKNLYSGKDLLLVNYYNKALGKSIKNGHKLVTVSDFTKSSLLNYFNNIDEQITVIKNTLSGPFYYKLIDNVEEDILNFDYDFVLYSGGWEKRKDENLLFNSIRTFLDNDNGRRDLKFVLTGKSESFKLILKKKYNFSDTHLKRIIFYERLSRDSLAVAYKKCLFVLNLSLFEGFGFPVLESLLANKCILCSNIPAYHEIGEQHCDYVIERHPEAISDQICNLFDSIKNTSSITYEKQNYAIKLNNMNINNNKIKVKHLFLL